MLVHKYLSKLILFAASHRSSVLVTRSNAVFDYIEYIAQNFLNVLNFMENLQKISNYLIFSSSKKYLILISIL
jgi:hypothetical protein